MLREAGIDKRLHSLSEPDRWSGRREQCPVEQRNGMMARPSTKQLGSQTVFLEKLYKKCWPGLCSWLRSRYGGGPPEPEDLAQAAFEKFPA